MPATQAARIEFSVAFWDPSWPSTTSKIEAHFDANSVTVIVDGSATLAPAGWDTIRSQVAASAQPAWSGIYQSSSLGSIVSRLAAPGMMAFAALHVLVPDFAAAMAMTKFPANISSYYAPGVRTDGMGNKLRLLHASLSQAERQAAEELFALEMLHRLDVDAYLPQGGTARFSVYFAPFHMPGVATSQLSSAAIALKDSLP